MRIKKAVAVLGFISLSVVAGCQFGPEVLRLFSA